jgi:hypothetical protein
MGRLPGATRGERRRRLKPAFSRPLPEPAASRRSRGATIRHVPEIAELEARLSRNSTNSNRPPSSDPPFVTQPSASPRKGTPGAKPGHPGHLQARLEPTEVIEVKPEVCPCGQREFPETTPYYTHQVLELPAIRMHGTHVVLHEACCLQCARIIKMPLPEKYRYGYGPRLTALIGELCQARSGTVAARSRSFVSRC